MLRLLVLSLTMFLFLIGTLSRAQVILDVESGLAFPGYNDVRIPNEMGTLFSFQEDFETEGPVIPLRTRLGFSFNEKNHIFALYAPLGINYNGTATKNISFQSSIFQQGETLDGYYQFNSYRLTYRRDILKSGDWLVGVGFTAKIRDAQVRLANDQGLRDKKDDLGFVPLLHLYTSYNLGGKKLIYFEGDGLAGGPGRAFDLFLGTRLPITERIDIKAGYRFLEGGANVDEVYNFTLVQFAVAGLYIQL
ncbi:hypothetical protein [Cyclobacterium jeungdonense]|uniref:Outer membrane protein beta-barrel domain-containing protein n=1 Tax=Cyclobacterium jeungdonense TaxID=708087 RepID=A0ABT8C7Z2_9BACT|nr:hypothetical protein [Cyclobacterium jeungdonense]MDN3687870.1 hypothetical protein [Cyclobacterium jeungdonense]